MWFGGNATTSNNPVNGNHLSSRFSRVGLAARTVFGKATLPRSTIVASLVISLLGLALPLVMLQIYDRILVNKSEATFVYLMLGLGTAILLEGALKTMRAYLIGWSATKHNYAKEHRAITRLVMAPVAVFSKIPTSVWMDRLESLDKYNAFESGQSRLILLDLPFVLLYIAFIYVIAQPLAYALCAMIAIFVLMISLRTRALQKCLAERSEIGQRKDDFVAETLEGIEAVKSLAMEPQMLRRFERLQITSSSVSHRSLSLSNELQIYSQLIGNAVLVTIVTVGAYLTINSFMSVGTLAACTLLTSRVMQPVVRSAQVFMELEGALQARENAGKIFELPERQIWNFSEDSKQQCGSIDITDLTYYREGSESPALSGIDLAVHPGEFIGIRGEQGSGKSTLQGIILGELQPSQGSCLVNGIESFNPDSDQNDGRIIRVSQESAVFRGTILENITMFRDGPEITENARRAARLIGLEDDVHRLPRGFETLIGAGISETLSRGMCQRIVIARALALGPQVLLFDEANAMLDLRADEALRRGLDRLKGEMTIILVSNRPSMLAIADRSYVLRRGTLIPEMPEAQHVQASIA